MKLALAFAAVLAAVALTSSAVIKASPRTDLSVGYIAEDDRLLYRGYVNKIGAPNTVQSEDVIYRGNASTFITAVRATEIGSTQWASSWVVSGAVGTNNVTVRFQSYTGYGYYYLVDIWGRF